MKIRDQRNGEFFWAQNELFDVFQPLIGANGVVVYMAICRMLSDRRWREGRLPLRDIAECSGLSKDTVRRSRDEMVALGMITERVSGPKAASTFDLLDLKEAALPGPEELERRLTLVQTRDLPSASPPQPSVSKSVSPRDRFATDFATDLSHSRDRCAPQSELFLKATATTERESTGAREALHAADAPAAQKQERVLDLVALAGMIVVAHPRARMRGWTPLDVLPADRMAVIAAARAEAERNGTTPEDEAVGLLNKVEQIAREVPRDQWRFLKEIDKFFRLREYRMQPRDLYRNNGEINVRTQPHQQQSSRSARVSPALERGANSRLGIDAAIALRKSRFAGRADEADAGPLPQPGAPTRHAADVSGGVGGDGPPLRAA